MGKGDNTKITPYLSSHRPAVVLILGLCIVGGGVSLLSRLVSGPSTEPKRLALPHEGGAEATPAFSPDGKRLAFSGREAGGKGPYHIRVRSVAGGPAAQLTGGPASDFGPGVRCRWRQIAFLRVDGDRARYMALAAAGGEPRAVTDFPVPTPPPGPQPAVCWTRDGQSLYVVQWAEPLRLSSPRCRPPVARRAALLNRRRVCTAIAPPRFRPMAKPRSRARPPDRAEHDGEGDDANGSDVFLSDLSGNKLRRLTFENASIHGIAWSADGRDLIYAASRGAGEKLWRIDASGGSPRNVLAGGRNPAWPAVAPVGAPSGIHRTPSLDAIWRIALTASDPASSARLLIRSDGREIAPRWSPDGKKIADISTQTGADEIWVGDADGNHRAPITHMKAFQLRWLRWSPDGRTILFMDRGNGEINVNRVASDGQTEPARIPLPLVDQVSWSHDGQSIYFRIVGPSEGTRRWPTAAATHHQRKQLGRRRTRRIGRW